MGLLIRNGRIITASDDYVADVYAEGETITRIEPSIDPGSLPPGVETIDARGKYVFPGFIDPHVHIHLPFMGTNAIDDHASASRAALAGGTTSVIEMICPGPTDEPMDAFAEWKSRAEAGAAVDYSFHMSVVRFDESAQAQFRRIVEQEGIPSFKVFLAYKGALDLGDEDLFGALSLARKLGVIVTAHCENAEAIDAMQRRLLAEGKTGPEWHEPSRPISVEADGVHHLATMAELTGAHIYTVHTSCEPAVRAAVDARLRGVNIWIEAVLPHLVLDKSAAERPDFEGAKYVMSPPLREKRHQDVLWAGLSGRTISTIGTDHAPFNFNGQKDMGRDAFTKIPNGIPSIQERPALVYTYGVRTGRIDQHTFVDACSTQAARLFGMYPRKGDIRVGADADLVVWDPDFEGKISKETSLSAVDYNAFEGWFVHGRASVVTVRGQIQARDGAFVGTEGRGRMIPREPTHF
ncbi:MAG: dihydropyrimidinase [Planctomycetota bacterium]|nr:MAG: dihydropyrimidinase [Planctomycetota bacterium]